MDDNNINIEELSSYTNVTKKKINEILNNEWNIRISDIIKVYRYFNINLNFKLVDLK